MAGGSFTVAAKTVQQTAAEKASHLAHPPLFCQARVALTAEAKELPATAATAEQQQQTAA